MGAHTRNISPFESQGRRAVGAEGIDVFAGVAEPFSGSVDLRIRRKVGAETWYLVGFRASAGGPQWKGRILRSLCPTSGITSLSGQFGPGEEGFRR